MPKFFRPNRYLSWKKSNLGGKALKRIGWFSTARGPGSLNLFTTILKSIDAGEVRAEIAFIFINRDVDNNQYRKKIIKMAEEHGIPVILFPSDKFMPDLKITDPDAWRLEYGKELRKRIAQYQIDFGVLAGYMLIIDPETCSKYTLINLHPALPNTYKGTWEEVVQKVVENHDASYGATVHICTPDLDRGETIAYDSFDLKDIKARSFSQEDLVMGIRAEGVRREAPLLVETIKLLADDEVTVKDWEVFDRNGKKAKTYRCLAEKVSEDLTLP